VERVENSKGPPAQVEETNVTNLSLIPFSSKKNLEKFMSNLGHPSQLFRNKASEDKNYYFFRYTQIMQSSLPISKVEWEAVTSLSSNFPR